MVKVVKDGKNVKNAKNVKVIRISTSCGWARPSSVQAGIGLYFTLISCGFGLSRLSFV